MMPTWVCVVPSFLLGAAVALRLRRFAHHTWRMRLHLATCFGGLCAATALVGRVAWLWLTG